MIGTIKNKLQILKDGEFHNIYFNSYDEYKKVTEAITLDIIDTIKDIKVSGIPIKDFFVTIRNMEEDLQRAKMKAISDPYDDGKKGIKRRVEAIANAKSVAHLYITEIIKAFSKYRGLKLFSSHLFTDKTREEFITSRTNRAIRSEIEWFTSHFESAYISKEVLESSETIKDISSIVPGLKDIVNLGLLVALSPRGKDINSELTLLNCLDIPRYLQWNGIYLFSGLQNSDVYRYIPETRDFEIFNEHLDDMMSDIVSYRPIGNSYVAYDKDMFVDLKQYFKNFFTRSTLSVSLLKMGRNYLSNLKVNPTFFKILLHDYDNSARTITLDDLETKLFNYDLSYYSNLDEKDALAVCKFNVRSLFLSIPLIYRQGENHVANAIPKQLRDKRLKQLPPLKKMPVIYGIGQSQGKSFLMTVMSRYDRFVQMGFTEDISSAFGKTTITHSNIVEYAEINKASFKDSSLIKSFIGIESIKIRPYYTQQLYTYANQMMFIGTTNEKKFLRDPSGSVRFAVIPVKPFLDGNEERKGRALDANEFWDNESEYMNTMIHLQEEFFKGLAIIAKSKSSDESLRFKSYFSYDPKVRECKLGENEVNSHSTYKKNEELLIEEMFMSEKEYFSLDDKHKELLHSHINDVTFSGNMIELQKLVTNHILGSSDKPANYSFRNFSKHLKDTHNIVPDRRYMEINGIKLQKRCMCYSDIKAFSGIILLDKWNRLLEDMYANSDETVIEERDTESPVDILV